MADLPEPYGRYFQAQSLGSAWSQYYCLPSLEKLPQMTTELLVKFLPATFKPPSVRRIQNQEPGRQLIILRPEGEQVHGSPLDVLIDSGSLCIFPGNVERPWLAIHSHNGVGQLSESLLSQLLSQMIPTPLLKAGPQFEQE